jgi:PAS domain S-box-containing protein
MFLGKRKAKIAEQKRIEQMLQHLGMIAEQADEGIVVIDLKGILHFANMAWARMHGYETSNELLAKQITVFHTKEQMETSVMSCIELTSRKGNFKGEIEHMRKDGKIFMTHTKMTLLKDEQDNAAGLIIAVTDVTERKRVKGKLGENTQLVKELKKEVEKLQREISERKQAEEKLKATNEQLQQQVSERRIAVESIQQQIAELTAASEHIRREIAKSKLQREKPRQSVGEAEELEEEIIPLDTEKLKALSEMAKRLK